MSTETTTTFPPGTVLEGKWIIIELIGKGAMGEVYRAHQQHLNRDVAIKTISAEVLAEIQSDPEERETAIARFRREVQTMAQVRHPNIITIYDYGEMVQDDPQDGLQKAYIVLEYVPGNTLRFTMDEDGLDDVPERYGAWIRQYFLPVLDGVEVLHDNRIIHRDLKPENIFLDGSIPKIADFGLARSHRMKAVTGSLEMLGTLAYMSPEQCSNFKNSESSTDIYALGKMLYEAANGTLTEKTLPFTSVRIEDPTTPFLAEMSRIIERATAEAPNDRHRSIRDLREDLVKALDLLNDEPVVPVEKKARSKAGKPGLSRFYGIIAWALVVLAVFSAMVWGYQLYRNREADSSLVSSTYTDHSALPKAVQVITVSDYSDLQPDIIGRDGSRMKLTPTGDDGNEADWFYVDEEKVSNFLFVEFLNSMAEKLTVEEGIVRYGETILIYIGSGSDEDDILYKHNRFHLADQTKGSRPVVRVTFHGAHLYAATYGKKMLTESQWRSAFRYHARENAAREAPNDGADRQMVVSMMSPVPLRRPAEEQPVVLDRMGAPVREWVLLDGKAEASGEETRPAEIQAGVIGLARLEQGEPPLKRFPWEGFADVGFRTAVPVIIKPTD